MRNWIATARTWSVPILLMTVSVGAAFALLSRWQGVPDLLWRSPATMGLLAIPMTAIILTGGIDLSVGSIVALSGVVLGLLYRDLELPVGVTVAGGVLTGTAAGTFNGLLVAMGIAPLVVTLATMALYAGLAMALVDGERITDLPNSLSWIGNQSPLGLPYSVWILLAIAGIYFVLVHHTWIGRALFAIGENRLAAQFAAVPVRRIETAMYVLSGSVAGLAAVLLTAENQSAIPDAGRGFELEAIACVVLGGTRVTGGYGSILRTMVGLVTLAHLQIALRRLSRMNLENFPISFDLDTRFIVIGCLVITVAVINERLAPRRR